MSSANKPRLVARPGFTVLESIVALAIISMVAVGTLSSVGAQLRSTDHAQRTTEALALADERMMAIRLLTLNDLASLPDNIASGRFAPPFDRYSWQVTTQAVSGEVGLYDVVVQINWSEGTYTLQSRVYYPPPVIQNNSQEDDGSGGGGSGMQMLFGTDGQMQIPGMGSVQFGGGAGGGGIQMGGFDGGTP
jgi:type II secretion system protein I